VKPYILATLIAASNVNGELEKCLLHLHPLKLSWEPMLDLPCWARGASH